MNSALGILIGLTTGATMAVAVSCVWVVLQLPARIQDMLQASSPKMLTWAMGLGLLLAALNNALGLRLPLPGWLGGLMLIPCGMFVGMLASALGEILEVAPVMMRRMRLGDVSAGVRWALLIGKGLGAVLACLVFTL